MSKIEKKYPPQTGLIKFDIEIMDAIAKQGADNYFKSDAGKIKIKELREYMSNIVLGKI